MLPFAGAAGSAALVALPFLAHEVVPWLAVPLAMIAGLALVALGVFWKRVTRWLYSGYSAATPAAPTWAQAADQRIWQAIASKAYGAFVLLGFALPAKFVLDETEYAPITLKLSVIGLAVVVFAWFTPLWVKD